MKRLVFLLLVVWVATTSAQISVVSTTPADNATGVALNTTVSITFSAALDSLRLPNLQQDQLLFSNVDSVTAQVLSVDHRTISWSVVLQPNTPYFVAIYGAFGQSGEVLSNRVGFRFTTGTSFPSNTVSGTLDAGSTGASLNQALVALSLTPLNAGNPIPIAGTFTDVSGNFTIPYVPAGTYYPIAAQDMNGDGQIDPSRGDALASGDSVVVTGNVTGLSITLMVFPPLDFSDAVNAAASTVSGLPPDVQLRLVNGYNVDATGHAGNWQFYYTSASVPPGFVVEVENLGNRVRTLDPGSANWVGQNKPISSFPPAGIGDSVVVRAERNGGSSFRTTTAFAPLVFQSQLIFGDLRNSQFWQFIPDTSKMYWGLNYSWGYSVGDTNWVSEHDMYVLASASTGSILTMTGVSEHGNAAAPARYSLGQNYPNPFNPSTTISFSLPLQSRVTLEIYNIVGQKVATLVSDDRPAGTYSVTWRPEVASGIYFYRLEANSTSSASHFVQVKRMAFVK